jgi:uncharacterized protein (TIGR02145 family)
MNTDKNISDASASDFVVINGLKWDRENTVIEGQEHLNHYEAHEIAQTNDKRLPTKEEFEALIALGGTWDDDRQGQWFGNDHELKSDSKESIFLPAAGYRLSSDDTLNYRNIYGRYWSAIKYGNIGACHLNFYCCDRDAYMTNANRSHGFSVRCVADINS